MRPARAAALALLLAALLPRPAQADDKAAVDAYKEGVAALQGGRARDALGSLQRALAEKAKEGSFKVGVATYEFLPSLRLAEAHLALGDCAAASSRLATAGSVKMSAKERAIYDALVPRVAACGGAAPAPASAAAPASAPAPARQECPQLAEAQAAFRDGDNARARRLASACLALVPGDPDARRIVDQVDAFLGGRLTAARQQQGAGNAAAALAVAREVLAVDPQNADAAALARQLETQVAAAPASAPAGAPAPSGATARPAATAVASASAPGPAPATAPAGSVSLPAGIAAYFRGDIDASIRALETADQTPQSLTVLACALATRSLLAKDVSAAESDISSARRVWKQAQQMKPGIGLDMSWVSPRVRAALQSEGG